MAQDAFNLMADPKGRAGTSSAFNNAYLSNKENLATVARKRGLVKQFGTKQGTAEFFQEGQVPPLTLHPTHYTLHTTHCTLHTAHYTLPAFTALNLD